jgi:hypothetical protein
MTGACNRAKGPPCLGAYPRGIERGSTRLGPIVAVLLLERVVQRLRSASARYVVTEGRCVL